MSKTEREMLELAAKACGIVLSWHDWGDFGIRAMGAKIGEVCAGPTLWNPLHDDGDCARMEAALGIEIQWAKELECAFAVVGDISRGEFYKDHAGDKQAAHRMASLRVAAAIGKAMARIERDPYCTGPLHLEDDAAIAAAKGE